MTAHNHRPVKSHVSFAALPSDDSSLHSASLTGDLSPSLSPELSDDVDTPLLLPHISPFPSPSPFLNPSSASPSPFPSVTLRRCIRWTRWLTLVLFLAIASVTLTHRTHLPSPSSSPQPPLSPTEREVTRLVTGHSPLTIPPSSLHHLRLALARLHTAVTAIRPSLHSSLTHSHTPTLPLCLPLSSSPSSPASPTPSWLNTWLLHYDPSSSPSSSPSTSPSPSYLSSLFPPHPSSTAGHSSNTSPTPLYPGEDTEGQAVPHRFQQALHARQHSVDCTQARLLVYDGEGRGEGREGMAGWVRRRAQALAVAFRDGRTLVEEREAAPPFLPLSGCALPVGWEAGVEKEVGGKGEEGQGDVGGMEEWEKRRVVAYSEVRGSRKGQVEEEDAAWGGQARKGVGVEFDGLPRCWWERQAVAYLLRLSPAAALPLTTGLAASLGLPSPSLTARHAVAYAAGAGGEVNSTAYTWRLLQAVKVEWQLHVAAPGLPALLRGEAGAESLTSGVQVDPRLRLPLLGWAGVQGGAGVEQAKRAQQALWTLGQEEGVWQWWLAGVTQSTAAAQAPPLRLYSAEGMLEEEEYGEVLGLMAGQVSDVTSGEVRSEYVRLVYEVGQAMSMTRLRSPLVDL